MGAMTKWQVLFVEETLVLFNDFFDPHRFSTFIEALRRSVWNPESRRERKIKIPLILLRWFGLITIR
jgi:hypothetical protein